MATTAVANDSTTQRFLPTEIAPYAQDVLSRTSELVDLPYQAYQGPRVAGFSNNQQSAFNQVAGLQSLGQNPMYGQIGSQISQGVNSFGIPSDVGDAMSGLGALAGSSSYNPAQAATFGTPAQTQAAQYGAAPMASASSVQASNLTPADFGQIQQFMSPYQQAVTDVAKREATRQNDLQTIARNANQVGRGAFGGTRTAIQDAEAARNLNQNLSDLQVRGSQDAYMQAVRALEAQRQYDTGVGTTNAGFSQQVGLANQQAQAAAQAANAGFSQQANLANQQAQQQALNANAGFMQQTNLANQQAQQQAYNQQLAALQAQGALGLNQYGAQQSGLQTLSNLQGNLQGQEIALQNADLQRINALSQAGAQEQALAQRQADVGYQNFLEARDYDIGLLGKYANIIGSIPQASNTQTQVAQPNTLTQIGGILGAGAGLLGSLGGLGNLFGGTTS